MPRDNTPIYSPIAISYRDEGHGQGPFYDHYTVRKITNKLTIVAKPDATSTNIFASYLNQREGFKDFGLTLDTTLPESFSSVVEKAGLLLIPGRAHETESKRAAAHQARTQHEKQLIKEARLHGQPILAICAGSWQVWEAFGGTLISVENHNYGAGMPRILQNGRIGYNKQIHRVKIESHTLLAAAMGYTAATIAAAQPSVNSVHWMAADATNTPPLLKVCATTVRDDSIAPNSRQGGIMAVQANTPEAFETQHGAPVLGIQWHPEAYNADDDAALSASHQLAILNYMAQAGHTYQQKRRVIQELKTQFRLSQSNSLTFFGKPFPQEEDALASQELSALTAQLGI